MFLLTDCLLVLTVADITSVLHLNQDSLHGPVPAQGRDVPTSLKVRLHSHLNTAPKDAFLKTVLLGVPHIRLDFTDSKQKNIRKPVEKNPSKVLFDKTRDSGKAGSINNLENFEDPIRNSNLQKSVTVASANVNTISLASSFRESSFVRTTPTSFVTPATDTQQVKIMDQTAPYRRTKKGFQSTLGTDRLFQRASVISNISHWISTTSAPNINTFGTDDHLQSETFLKVDTTESFAPSTTSYPGFMVSKHESVSFELDPWSTAPSTSRGLFEQRPDLTETLPPPDTTGYISSGEEILTTATQLVSDLHLKAPTDIHSSIDITGDQVNEKSNQSDPKQTLDPSAWKDLPRFSRMHRPVCPYPPFPSHGTFYFRSIKNPDPLQYKHYIQYACYPGYTLTNGDVYSYCQHNGQWSGQTPLCLGEIYDTYWI